jgi:hypothetical protein
MKATIDIPDDLYRRVKAKSALAGRAVREVTIELYQQWLATDERVPASSAQDWLQSWLGRADELMETAPAGPAAREILEGDRGRLDPGQPRDRRRHAKRPKGE